MTTRNPRLLAIAGSDSSGGAGIQADIKTASALGVYAMTAITAVTAQDTTGIGAIQLISPAIVREQIARCLSDIGADAIKIGMLGSAEIARAVAAAGRARQGHPARGRSGDGRRHWSDVADRATVEVLKSDLFPRSRLITPNLPEAEALCGFAVATPDAVVHAGEMLLSLGPQAVLIKGRHGGGDTLTDTLFTPDDPRAASPRHASTRATPMAPAARCRPPSPAALRKA